MNWRALVLVVFLGLMLSAVVVFAQDEVVPPTVEVGNNGTVNMRPDPSTNQAQVGTLSGNQDVLVIDSTNFGANISGNTTWHLVRIEDEEGNTISQGWVSGSLLEITPAQQQQAIAYASSLLMPSMVVEVSFEDDAALTDPWFIDAGSESTLVLSEDTYSQEAYDMTLQAFESYEIGFNEFLEELGYANFEIFSIADTGFSVIAFQVTDAGRLNLLWPTVSGDPVVNPGDYQSADGVWELELPQAQIRFTSSGVPVVQVLVENVLLGMVDPQHQSIQLLPDVIEGVTAENLMDLIDGTETFESLGIEANLSWSVSFEETQAVLLNTRPYQTLNTADSPNQAVLFRFYLVSVSLLDIEDNPVSDLVFAYIKDDNTISFVRFLTPAITGFDLNLLSNMPIERYPVGEHSDLRVLFVDQVDEPSLSRGCTNMTREGEELSYDFCMSFLTRESETSYNYQSFIRALANNPQGETLLAESVYLYQVYESVSPER